MPTVARTNDDGIATRRLAHDHTFRDSLDNRTPRHAHRVDVYEAYIPRPTREMARRHLGLVTVAVADDGGGGRRARGEQVPRALVDAVHDGGEGHHGLVQDTRLVVLDRVTVLVPAFLAALLAFAGHARAEVLCVLAYLSDRLRGQACGAGGEGIDFADALLRCGGEGHGFGIGFGLFLKVVGAGGHGTGDVRAARDYQTGGAGGGLDDGGFGVCGMARHAQVVF